ncbi:hypothetical protein AB0B39_25630 [Micromonospora sp. NPDC049114]|uniref:hypothetical protein n=1 Tax=Micromonospora sp. NPDC049114 TaxID=3155498 RepID=UPI0033F02618
MASWVHVWALSSSRVPPVALVRRSAVTCATRCAASSWSIGCPFWDTTAGARLGYLPVDDAEVFADGVPGSRDPVDPAARQGGAFTDAAYSLRHVRADEPSW